MEIELESAFKEIKLSIIDTIKKHPPERENVYSCGFWLFYCDYSMLGTPCFAYNIEGEYEDDTKWCPPEWVVDVEDSMIDALEPHYEKISELMAGKSDEAWEDLVKYQYEFYCNLCLQLNDMSNTDNSPFKNWNTTNDFVIGVFEEREGEELYDELVKLSVGSSREKALEIC